MYNMMRKTIFIAAAALLAVSCADKNLCTVQCVLTEEDRAQMDGSYAYLCHADNYWDVIDSVKIDNGCFTFKCPAETSEKVVLRGPMTGGRIDNFCKTVFIEPGVVTVDLETGYSKGTPSNEAYALFMEQQREGWERMQTAQTIEQLAEIMSAREADALVMLEQNGDNLFGASMLEIVDNRMSASEMIEAIGAFPEPVRRSRLVTGMLKKAEAQLATEVGRPYIDIVLPDTEGNELALSSVVGNPDNKYVLLDFWATWCGPCMGEVPHLKEAYAKYHDKGFEIYGVSCDRSEDEWLNGIREHDMNWLHVIQPRDGEMDALGAYGVTLIPSNFLIERATGKIVATNLRGEALGRKIAELLD